MSSAKIDGMIGFMFAALYAFISVAAWGTWLVPSQNVQYPNQQVKTLYVTAANLVIVVAVTLLRGVGSLSVLTPGSFWLVFAGGIVWTISGLCAFTATAKIGLARAFGIWAPLNIVTGVVWGAVVFGEFPNTDAAALLALGVSLVLILAGVLLIIFARGSAEAAAGAARFAWLGYAAALATGVLWGSYFVPIKLAGISMMVGALPLSLGMFTASSLMVLFSRRSPKLNRPGDALRTLLTGVLWCAGNYGTLLLVGVLGAGRGFTISQLSVVVNALIGIFFLKDPAPRSRAAWLTLIGCVLATLGGVALGNLK